MAGAGGEVWFTGEGDGGEQEAVSGAEECCQAAGYVEGRALREAHESSGLIQGHYSTTLVRGPMRTPTLPYTSISATSHVNPPCHRTSHHPQLTSTQIPTYLAPFAPSLISRLLPPPPPQELKSPRPCPLQVEGKARSSHDDETARGGVHQPGAQKERGAWSGLLFCQSIPHKGEKSEYFTWGDAGISETFRVLQTLDS